MELARTNKVDVAVFDIRPGGMSGLELLDRLKEQEPNLEAVMETGVRQARSCPECALPNAGGASGEDNFAASKVSASLFRASLDMIPDPGTDAAAKAVAFFARL